MWIHLTILSLIVGYYFILSFAICLATSSLPKLARISWLIVHINFFCSLVVFIANVAEVDRLVGPTFAVHFFWVVFPSVVAGLIVSFLLIALAAQHKRGKRYQLYLPTHGVRVAIVALLLVGGVFISANASYGWTHLQLIFEEPITYVDPTGTYRIDIGKSWTVTEEANGVKFSRVLPRDSIYKRKSCDPAIVESELSITEVNPLNYCRKKGEQPLPLTNEENIRFCYNQSPDTTFTLAIEVGGETPLIISDAKLAEFDFCKNAVVDAYVIANDGKSYNIQFNSDEETVKDIMPILQTFHFMP